MRKSPALALGVLVATTLACPDASAERPSELSKQFRASIVKTMRVPESDENYERIKDFIKRIDAENVDVAVTFIDDIVSIAVEAENGRLTLAINSGSKFYTQQCHGYQTFINLYRGNRISDWEAIKYVCTQDDASIWWIRSQLLKLLEVKGKDSEKVRLVLAAPEACSPRSDKGEACG